MHIEPGIIAQAKVMLANVAGAGVLAAHARHLIKSPINILRAAIAAVFFTLFMQSFHTPVGPSELHFVGAMAIYLTLGFIPTMFGFAIGLALQGMIFDPMDMMHLAVNSLSLILPLIAVHMTLGRRLQQGAEVSWKQILKMDAMYYSGVATMVGFWLMMADVATPFAAWATFASSYLIVIAFEPLYTYATLRLLKRYEGSKIVELCFAVKTLKVN